MAKKRVLCFGDSLTWGYDPDNRVRFPEESRWPMVMQSILDDGYTVIEEGQNGRTIATDDPAEGEKNGLKYIGPCLESHSPLDVVIIMLGSNDCKRKYAYSSMDIAGEMQIMLEKILSYNRFRCNDGFKVILVSPPEIGESIKQSWLGDSFAYENAIKLTKELPDWYSQLATMYGCTFFDASKHVKASNSDSCHLDADNQRKLGQLLAEVVKSLPSVSS
ncbi:MAG: SGNH/GDSL hydrolase family protein [Lachnospiraceae bacterium]|nr:SGNH/GDSL hydrolase family protein [Lachnospiraceae bacterium]